MSQKVLFTICPFLLLASAYGQALPKLSIADVTVSESGCGSQVATFTVTVSAPFGKNAAVQYATRDGSAIAGRDYTAASGILSFPRGSRAPQIITVPITDVLVPGPNKTFFVKLSHPVDATLTNSQAIATIVAPTVAKCRSCGLSCDDGNACTTDACDAVRGCIHLNASALGKPYCQLSSDANFAACNGSGSWVDSDGDGFSDAAEIQGYVDVNANGVYDPGVDIPLPDADPQRPDVYLHYDYAYAADHNHNPPPEAIRYIVEAFAAHGIRLHIDPQHNALCEHQGDANCITAGTGAKVVTLGAPLSGDIDVVCAGPSAVSMRQLRAAIPYLDLIKPVYHYMVFAHYATCPDAGHCSSCPADPENPACVSPSQPPAATNLGTSEIFGNDSIVATQPFVDIGVVPGIPAVPLEAWSGLAMHEFGHNLGLLHGGADCFNNKPNYLSAMNYRFYTQGIPVAPFPGLTQPTACFADTDCSSSHAASAHCSAFTHTCFRIDYSDRASDLDETNLNESLGLPGSPANDTDISFRHQISPTTGYVPVPTNGVPIDWDGNGFIGSGVIFDVNGDGSVNPLPGQNDWASVIINGVSQAANLKFPFQCQVTYTNQLVPAVTGHP